MSTNNNTAKLASHKSIPHPIRNNNKSPNFQVGDFVRVSDKRNFYSKGYTTNWNREFFEKHKINPYGLVDENNKQIEGKNYEQELLRSIFNFKSNNKTLQSMNVFHQ